MTKYQCPRCKHEIIIRINPNDNTVIYCPTCSIPMYVIWENVEEQDIKRIKQ